MPTWTRSRGTALGRVLRHQQRGRARTVEEVDDVGSGKSALVRLGLYADNWQSAGKALAKTLQILTFSGRCFDAPATAPRTR
ncbi:hypothetical protein E4U22_000630 [Claviceps purpurea]|nr:hypothetical protein E4U24_004216 [Claviceps purpurea]KAG6322149.1 hypothetical protein E4U22_000630 [Claviceps purpurea]